LHIILAIVNNRDLTNKDSEYNPKAARRMPHEVPAVWRCPLEPSHLLVERLS